MALITHEQEQKFKAAEKILAGKSPEIIIEDQWRVNKAGLNEDEENARAQMAEILKEILLANPEVRQQIIDYRFHDVMEYGPEPGLDEMLKPYRDDFIRFLVHNDREVATLWWFEQQVTNSMT